MGPFQFVGLELFPVLGPFLLVELESFPFAEQELIDVEQALFLALEPFLFAELEPFLLVEQELIEFVVKEQIVGEVLVGMLY